jgi:hypothetical protein
MYVPIPPRTTCVHHSPGTLFNQDATAFHCLSLRRTSSFSPRTLLPSWSLVSIADGGQPMNEEPTEAGKDGIQSDRRWPEISAVVMGSRVALVVPTFHSLTNTVAPPLEGPRRDAAVTWDSVLPANVLLSLRRPSNRNARPQRTHSGVCTARDQANAHPPKVAKAPAGQLGMRPPAPGVCLGASSKRRPFHLVRTVPASSSGLHLERDEHVREPHTRRAAAGQDRGNRRGVQRGDGA